MSDVSIPHPDDPDKVIVHQQITGQYPDLTITLTVELGPILRQLDEEEGRRLVERGVRVITPDGQELTLPVE